MVFDKSVAIAMLPLSILIILETTGIYSISLFFDKAIIGALLMIALQVIGITFAVSHQGHVRVMNIVIGVVLIVPALLYLLPSVDFLREFLPLIIGTMMFTESVYALH